MCAVYTCIHAEERVCVHFPFLDGFHISALDDQTCGGSAGNLTFKDTLSKLVYVVEVVVVVVDDDDDDDDVVVGLSIAQLKTQSIEGTMCPIFTKDSHPLDYELYPTAVYP